MLVEDDEDVIDIFAFGQEVEAKQRAEPPKLNPAPCTHAVLILAPRERKMQRVARRGKKSARVAQKPFIRVPVYEDPQRRATISMGRLS